MQYYASLDSNGNMAFYNDVVHGTGIPTGAIEITEEQWQDAVANQGKYSIQNGQFVADSVWPPVPTADQVFNSTMSMLTTSAAAAYVAGFQSSASGQALWYDSDADSQAAINRQFLLAVNNPTYYNATVFMPSIAAGLTPITARPAKDSPDSTKTTQLLNAAQMIQLGTDLGIAWADVKSNLWAKKEVLNKAYQNNDIAGMQAVTW